MQAEHDLLEQAIDLGSRDGSGKCLEERIVDAQGKVATPSTLAMPCGTQACGAQAGRLSAKCSAKKSSAARNLGD
jgi:hypothetical protein